MRTLSEKQKSRLKELNERFEVIDKIIVEKIEDPIQPIPLNLILEARFITIMRKAINLEGEVKFLEDKNDPKFNGQIEVRKRRLDSMRGQLNELTNVGDMIQKYDLFGREFEIVRK